MASSFFWMRCCWIKCCWMICKRKTLSFVLIRLEKAFVFSRENFPEKEKVPGLTDQTKDEITDSAVPPWFAALWPRALQGTSIPPAADVCLHVAAFTAPSADHYGDPSAADFSASSALCKLVCRLYSRFNGLEQIWFRQSIQHFEGMSIIFHDRVS